MRSLNDWLSEYGESHQNPTNVLIHKVCVPLIMFSILGLIWAIPRPSFMESYELLNFSTLFVIPIMSFYLVLSFKMFLGMFIMLAVMFSGVYQLDQLSFLLECSIVIFVLSWIAQFWGHKIEGKKPSFFQDLLFLFIGPLWVLNSLYKKIGVKV